MVKIDWCSGAIYRASQIGGRRGSRTLTSLRRRDFKSLVSAIPPPAHPNTKNGGGTGIRTLDNGFAIRCLSPLGHAASCIDRLLSCSKISSYAIPKYVSPYRFISQILRFYCNYDLIAVICTVFNHEIINPNEKINNLNFRSPILVKKFNITTKKPVLSTSTRRAQTLVFFCCAL